MQENRVQYEVIEKAMQQDEAAILKIMAHYRAYIRKLARREIVLENGKQIQIVDEDVAAELEEKLVESISKFKFLPEKESV